MFGFFGQNRTPKPTFRVFSKADEGRCLAVSDGALILAAADPGDERQHWTKDVRYSRVVQDKEGHPVFSLVNAATGLAVQHALGPGHPVRLARFYPDGYDESVLWTESADLRKAFGCIRMMHNVGLAVDAPLDGDDVVLSYVSNNGLPSDGQSWKTVPWNGDHTRDLDGLDSAPTSRIYCKADKRFSVIARDGAVCLARTDPGDEFQHWVVDKRPGDIIKNDKGYPAFAIVNKVTGEAISGEQNKALRLKPYNPNFLDASVLWTTSFDHGQGFRHIHCVDNFSANFDACYSYRAAKLYKPDLSLKFRKFILEGYKVPDSDDDDDGEWEVSDGAKIGLSCWEKEDSHMWKIVHW